MSLTGSSHRSTLGADYGLASTSAMQTKIISLCPMLGCWAVLSAGMEASHTCTTRWMLLGSGREIPRRENPCKIGYGLGAFPFQQAAVVIVFVETGKLHCCHILRAKPFSSAALARSWPFDHHSTLTSGPTSTHVYDIEPPAV